MVELTLASATDTLGSCRKVGSGLAGNAQWVRTAGVGPHS